MIKVSITKQSNYPVNSPKIKKQLSAFFQKQGIVSDAEVSVAIVGETKMLQFQKKFFKEGDPTSPFGFRGASGKLHNVLSFTPTEVSNFVMPPDNIIHLGEIIVCYPQAAREANTENVLIDQKVYELIEHGALHLLGIHHAE